MTDLEKLARERAEKAIDEAWKQAGYGEMPKLSFELKHSIAQALIEFAAEQKSALKPGSTYRICEYCGAQVEGAFICKCQREKTAEHGGAGGIDQFADSYVDNVVAKALKKSVHTLNSDDFCAEIFWADSLYEAYCAGFEKAQALSSRPRITVEMIMPTDGQMEAQGADFKSCEWFRAHVARRLEEVQK